jgi:hypothetical protein
MLTQASLGRSGQALSLVLLARYRGTVRRGVVVGGRGWRRRRPWGVPAKQKELWRLACVPVADRCSWLQMAYPCMGRERGH